MGVGGRRLLHIRKIIILHTIVANCYGPRKPEYLCISMHVIHIYLRITCMYVRVYHTVMVHATPPPCSVKYDASVIILLIIIFDGALTIIVIVYPYHHQPLPSHNMLLVFKFSRKILNFNPAEWTGERAGPLVLSPTHSPDLPLPASRLRARKHTSPKCPRKLLPHATAADRLF